jgi:hypothetical protein
MIATVLRAGGWVAFGVSLAAELAQLARPRMDWLGLVVFWALVASALLHLGAGVVGRRAWS